MNRKILIAAYGFFPAQAYGGPPVSIDNFCTQMSDYDVYVVARDHDIYDMHRLNGIHDGWNDRGNCKVLYLADSEYTERRFENVISEIRPDLIYIQTFFQVKTFLGPVLAARKNNLPVLLAPRGEFCNGAMKKKYKKIPYIYLLKMLGLFKNMYFQATSTDEYQKILFYLNKDRARVFFLENFPSIPNTTTVNISNLNKGDRLKVITLSRIVPKKNLIFACKCMGMVKGKVDWDIYGQTEDTKYWSECEKIIALLPNNIRVNYKGSIDHGNVIETFQNYNAMLFPTLSENYGHSIVEAMLSGCIPVISDQTPWHDLRKNKAGFDLPLRDKNSFSEAIDFLANMNTDEIKEWSSNCIKYITDRIDVPSLKKKYDDAFGKIE